MEENINILGNTIKEARIAKGYSKQYLSKSLKISRMQLYNIETGKSIPRLSTLKPLCNVLNINFEEITKQCNYHYNNYDENILGDTIRDARIAKDYSQQFFAYLCKMSREQISNIENGKSIPHPSTLELICIHLSLDFQEISKLSAKG